MNDYHPNLDGPAEPYGLSIDGNGNPLKRDCGSSSGHTYASDQATNCAVCGEHKHTPLRNDRMGGYVCLTCIDRELIRLQKCLSLCYADANYISVEWLRSNGHDYTAKAVENIRKHSSP